MTVRNPSQTQSLNQSTEADAADNVSIREFDARLAEIRRAVDLAEAAAGSKVELKEHVEALLTDLLRATEIAERERASAAQVLREEQHRFTETASNEREKSAQALREGMDRSIKEGDDRLREHILNQVQQIQAALISADKLEVERIGLVKTEVSNLDFKVAGLFEEKQKALDAALTAQKEAVVKAEVATDRIAARAQTDQDGLRLDMQERLAAVRRELEQATAAQKEAVLKAEAANEKRFESTNEWRGQSLDRERTQQEQRSRLESTFVQREVVEVQFAELRKQIDVLQHQQSTSMGRTQGTEAQIQDARTVHNTSLAASALATQVKGIYVVVAVGLFAALMSGLVALVTHGFH